MEPLDAVRASNRHIETIATARYATALPELSELIARHRYFGVYAVGRTAPLGGGLHTTHAALALFPRSLVAHMVGKVAAADGVEDLREQYVAACAAAGDRLLAEFDDAEELAQRLETLIERADFRSRTLAAAWADLPRPEGAGARVELATTVLRELRGGAHVSVLATHGLLDVEALLLGALWRGRTPEGGARSFGYRDDDIEGGWARLIAAGRVTSDREITDEGRAERQAIEDLTEAFAAQPWVEVDADDRATTVELLAGAAEVVRVARLEAPHAN